MIISKPIYFTLGLAILLGTGCSTMKSARETAGALALYTTQVKTDSEKFAAARLELDKARTANIDATEQLAARLENDNALCLKVWHLSGNEDRAKLFEGLTGATDLVATQNDQFAALRAKQAAAIAGMKSAIGRWNWSQSLRSMFEELGQKFAAFWKRGQHPRLTPEIVMLVILQFGQRRKGDPSYVAATFADIINTTPEDLSRMLDGEFEKCAKEQTQNDLASITDPRFDQILEMTKDLSCVFILFLSSFHWLSTNQSFS
jgi:hypothetical protein